MYYVRRAVQRNVVEGEGGGGAWVGLGNLSEQHSSSYCKINMK